MEDEMRTYPQMQLFPTRRRFLRWPLVLAAVILAGLLAFAYTTTRPTFEDVVAGMEPQDQGTCTVHEEQVPCVHATRSFFVLFDGNEPVAVVDADMEYVWQK